jgi:hypothetical protein
MKKMIILCLIAYTLTTSHTMVGMLLQRCRPHTKRTVIQHRKYNGGAEINNAHIMVELAKQKRILNVLINNSEENKSLLNKIAVQQEAIAKLHINAITTNPHERANLFYEFLKDTQDPINQSKINHNDDLTKHEFGDKCPILGHYGSHDQ